MTLITLPRNADSEIPYVDPGENAAELAWRLRMARNSARNWALLTVSLLAASTYATWAAQSNPVAAGGIWLANAAIVGNAVPRMIKQRTCLISTVRRYADSPGLRDGGTHPDRIPWHVQLVIRSGKHWTFLGETLLAASVVATWAMHRHPLAICGAAFANAAMANAVPNIMAQCTRYLESVIRPQAAR